VHGACGFNAAHAALADAGKGQFKLGLMFVRFFLTTKV
jgi:hypothetical protein